MDEGWLETRVSRPVFRDSVMRFSIWEDGQAMEITPPVGVEPTIRVAVESASSSPSRWHESSWDHFEANLNAYEEAMRAVLWPLALRTYRFALDNPDEGFGLVSKRADFESPASLDLQVALLDIFLYDAGRDGVGYASFEFNVGWDDEHGVSILMHGLTPIGVSSRADFTCREDPSGHAKYCPPPK